jgi:zinc transporter
METTSSALVPDDEGLICAFGLVPLSAIGPEVLSASDPVEPVWLHFNLVDGRARGWLAEHAQLPELALEAFLELDPHIHVQVLPDGLIAVLGDLSYDFDAGGGFGTLEVYLDARRMISGRRQALKAVDRLRRELLGGLALESPIALFEHFVECLAETFAAVVAKLGKAVEDAEDEVLAGRFRDQGATLGRIRWLLARLRRHVGANRSALASLPARLPSFCSSERRHSLSHVIEHLVGVAQDLELVQERARLLQEEIGRRLGEATNRNIYLLSIVTTTLLPITLITGIFGMNLGGMPWANHPHGFAYVTLGIVTGVAVALFLLWRRQVF